MKYLSLLFIYHQKDKVIQNYRNNENNIFT